MKTIHKYLLMNFENTFRLPTGAKVVHVAAAQSPIEFPTLWVEFNPREEFMQDRTFKSYGTGDDIPADADYISTYIVGPFEWHVYEVKP